MWTVARPHGAVASAFVVLLLALMTVAALAAPGVAGPTAAAAAPSVDNLLATAAVEPTSAELIWHPKEPALLDDNPSGVSVRMYIAAPRFQAARLISCDGEAADSRCEVSAANGQLRGPYTIPGEENAVETKVLGLGASIAVEALVNAAVNAIASGAGVALVAPTVPGAAPRPENATGSRGAVAALGLDAPAAANATPIGAAAGSSAAAPRNVPDHHPPASQPGGDAGGGTASGALNGVAGNNSTLAGGVNAKPRAFGSSVDAAAPHVSGPAAGNNSGAAAATPTKPPASTTPPSRAQKPQQPKSVFKTVPVVKADYGCAVDNSTKCCFQGQRTWAGCVPCPSGSPSE
jgi:hypothetical protein